MNDTGSARFTVITIARSFEIMTKSSPTELSPTELSTGRTFGDLIQPFHVEGLGVRGRIVRLSAALDEMISPERYPRDVAELLAATTALGAALASGLKYEGVFTLQAQGNGPVSLLFTDMTSSGNLRAYARFDTDALAALKKPAGGIVPRLLGAGRLAFSVDQGDDMDRYQGITELTGATLADCAQIYFRQSEQLETAIILESVLDGNGAIRAAAFVVQKMPGENDEDEDGEAWQEASILSGTLSKSELLDPALSASDILYRLFHERGVRIFDEVPLRHACRCGREKVERTLGSFPRDEIEAMKVNGEISVVCEFCGTDYIFHDKDLENIFG